MESIKKRYDKAFSLIKTGDKKYKIEADFLDRLYKHLESFQPARSLPCTEEEKEYLNELFLITSKPVIYTANISEDDMGKDENDIPLAKKVIEYAKKEGAEYMVICAKTEEELTTLEDDEREMFLTELGLTESGLDRLVKVSYKILGLISYLTAGEKEVRAWTVEIGTKAPKAAGKIHSDFEKGFIRAEIVDYDVLVELGSFNSAKEKGKVRVEGKDYVIKDGDVVLFRFNV